MADHANPEFHAGLRRGASIAMKLRREHPDLSWEQWAEKLREGIQAEMEMQSDIAKADDA